MILSELIKEIHVSEEEWSNGQWRCSLLHSSLLLKEIWSLDWTTIITWKVWQCYQKPQKKCANGKEILRGVNNGKLAIRYVY